MAYTIGFLSPFLDKRKERRRKICGVFFDLKILKIVKYGEKTMKEFILNKVTMKQWIDKQT